MPSINYECTTWSCDETYTVEELESNDDYGQTRGACPVCGSTLFRVSRTSDT